MGRATGRRGECPLKAPPSLQEAIELPPALSDEDLTQERFDFVGNDVIGRASRVFSFPCPLLEVGNASILQATGFPGRSSIERDKLTDRPTAGSHDDDQSSTRPVRLGTTGNHGPGRSVRLMREGIVSRSGPWPIFAARPARAKLCGASSMRDCACSLPSRSCFCSSPSATGSTGPGSSPRPCPHPWRPGMSPI